MNLWEVVGECSPALVVFRGFILTGVLSATRQSLEIMSDWTDVRDTDGRRQRRREDIR